MKKTLSSPLMVLAVILSLGTGSCELVEKISECLCSPTTGNAKIDSFFLAAADLEAASARVETKVNGAVADLAEAVGLDRDATAAEVSAAVCDAFAAASVGFNLTYEPAECKASVDVAAKAAAECDVSVDPGSVEVQCQGSCEGTCRASCSGECRMPSVSAYCEGSCHGSCSVDVDATCYGTCHGTCSGTCSSMEGAQCAGSCDGTCTGKCETNVSASCSGECHGECTVTADPGGCNGRCEGSCEGHCEGSCSGNVEPPSVDAECRAQVEAKVEASVECEPPRIDFGVDTSSVENIAKISAQLGKIFGAAAEADVIFEALGTFSSRMSSAAGALISGELTPEQALCATTNLDTALGALGSASSSLETVVNVSGVMLTCS